MVTVSISGRGGWERTWGWGLVFLGHLESLAGFRPALQTAKKTQCHSCFAPSPERERNSKREFGGLLP